MKNYEGMAAVARSDTDEAGQILQYVHELARRLERIEKELARLLNKEYEQEGKIEERARELQRLGKETDQELSKVEASLQHVVHQTEKLVQAFKNSVRDGEFRRLQQRVDAWRGEEYITRAEFRKLLEEKLKK